MCKMYRTEENELLKMVECGGCIMEHDDGCYNCELNAFLKFADDIEHALQAFEGTKSDFLKEAQEFVIRWGEFLGTKDAEYSIKFKEEGIQVEGDPLREQIDRIKKL